MSPTTSPARVVAVVVAYNRRDLLSEVLDALAAQQVPVARIVVVDNASTDGSAEVARAAGELVDLVELPRNTGGAGGFAAGMAVALADHDPDWIWLMDDDTVPTPSALRALLDAVSGTDVAVAGSRVEWFDGSEHPMNTPRSKPFAGAGERREAASGGAMPIRSTSFVSMLVRADVVRDVGLPIADYFIWNDDFEYSARLLRRGTGLHVPASVVEHRTKTFGATDADPGARFYYEVRNKLWMLLWSRALSPAERVLYLGASLRRWVRTFLRSSDRGTLREAGARGLRDGLTTRPRSTEAVLAGLGPVSEDVAVVDASARGRTA